MRQGLGGGWRRSVELWPIRKSLPEWEKTQQLKSLSAERGPRQAGGILEACVALSVEDAHNLRACDHRGMGGVNKAPTPTSLLFFFFLSILLLT